MHGLIKSQNLSVGGVHKISNSMKKLDPINHTKRVQAVSRRTNPIPYRADYFGHRLHCDQNEKLQEFGICHVAGCDGYSGIIMNEQELRI